MKKSKENSDEKESGKKKKPAKEEKHMSHAEKSPQKLTPTDVLKGESPLVLTATLEPIAGDRIRMILPFPEAGGFKVMQGKTSISIDLTTPEGAQASEFQEEFEELQKKRGRK